MSAATTTIEVDTKTAQILRTLKAKAEEQGTTLDSLLRPLAESEMRPMEDKPLYETATPSELAKAFVEWAESHDRSIPPLPLEAISRESIYEDR